MNKYYVILAFNDMSLKPIKKDEKNIKVYDRYIDRLDLKTDEIIQELLFEQYELDKKQWNSSIDKLKQKIKPEDKLKIIVFGHGSPHDDKITNNGDNKKKNTLNPNQLTDRIVYLLDLLGKRANSAKDAVKTVVVMMSCVYGRAKDNDFAKSNAGTLHEGLRKRNKYVELVARTEISATVREGVMQRPMLRDFLQSSKESKVKINNDDDKYTRKMSFAKLRFSYDENQERKITLVDSSAENKPEYQHDSPEAKKIAWTLSTLDELLRYSSGKPDYELKIRFPTDKSNSNKQMIREALVAYDLAQALGNNPDAPQPDFLKQVLEYLAGTGQELPELPQNHEWNIKKIEHRNPTGFRAKTLGWDPASVVKIKSLLAQYPK